MKIHDIKSLKKIVIEDFPLVSLVLGKNKEPIDVLLEAKDFKKLDAQSLTPNSFLEEVETLPLFSKIQVIYLPEIEELKSSILECILKYVKAPNSWIHLILSGESATPTLIKSVDSQGVVFKPQEEKPWDKEKRLVQWLIQEGEKRHIALSYTLAMQLMKSVGKDEELLIQEIEKLACYLGERKEVTAKDLQTICCYYPQETLWQWGDALLSSDSRQSFQIGRHLLQEGCTLFALVAFLRTQLKQGLEILQSYRQGGSSAVSQLFPFLKGNLLEKKLSLLRNFGEHNLKKGLIVLFEMDAEAKNSSSQPEFLLDLLIGRFTLGLL